MLDGSSSPVHLWASPVVPYLDNRGLASALVVTPVLLAPPSAPAASPTAVVVVVPPSIATRGWPAFSSPTLTASPRFLTGVRLPCHTSFHLHDNIDLQRSSGAHDVNRMKSITVFLN